jgi:hypothetical protein
VADRGSVHRLGAADSLVLKALRPGQPRIGCSQRLSMVDRSPMA